MHYKDVTPSHLPSFLLPCPHCGSRLAITAIAPARLGNSAASNDLEDVTHTSCNAVWCWSAQDGRSPTAPTLSRTESDKHTATKDDIGRLDKKIAA
jgi:hypothetical protein